MNSYDNKKKEGFYNYFNEIDVMMPDSDELFLYPDEATKKNFN